MKARDFAYWLQGFFELYPESLEIGLSQKQAEVISKHLDLVFMHEIDPSFPDRAKLSEKHGPRASDDRSGKSITMPTLDELVTKTAPWPRNNDIQLMC